MEIDIRSPNGDLDYEENIKELEISLKESEKDFYKIREINLEDEFLKIKEFNLYWKKNLILGIQTVEKKMF